MNRTTYKQPEGLCFLVKAPNGRKIHLMFFTKQNDINMTACLLDDVGLEILDPVSHKLSCLHCMRRTFDFNIELKNKEDFEALSVWTEG